VNQESLELLEYGRLLELVGRYVNSPVGRRLLEATEPSSDRAELEASLAEAAEAVAYSSAASRPATRAGETPVRLRFTDIPDCEAAAAKLRIEGGVLDGTEIAALAQMLERATQVKLALGAQQASYPRLSECAAALADFRPALREISGKILPDGNAADDASVALARIRRDKDRQRKQIHSSLERFLKSHRDEGVLQEEFVTLRNDRFVVPVIPSARKRVAGVVHGSSGSGQTLFLEPMETIELNNDLVRLGEEELREIYRILRELSERLHAHAPEIRVAVRTLGELDFLFAKARFAEEFECVIPRFSPTNQPRLHLDRARHPLLEDVLRRHQKRVVPVTLELDSSRRTLLISGPNTGGKTVAMKTVGLLALMAQSALPVPAEVAELPIFPDVLADIGDNQSIEQSLSSFGAHVARVKEMVEEATPGVLVLLDELGRATDPEEGGALGVAILEEFRHYGAFTLSSTHLLAIKVYGANTEGVVNASMGFNEETLEPTYLLRTGAPGKSAGLDIASRLGLPKHLIDRARAAMSTTERDIALFLNRLEEKVHEATQEAEALRVRQKDLDERERQMLGDLEKRAAKRIKQIEDQANAAQKQFEQESARVIEQVLGEPEQRRTAERALRQAARARREFQETVEALKDDKKPAPKIAPAEIQAGIQAGARVRLRDVSDPAKVLRVLKNGNLEVAVGLLKMQVGTSEVLEILPPAPDKSRLPQGVSFQSGPRWDTLSRELNVIGKNSEEASIEVERFLDSACLAGVTRVRIVHGHGMGILRRMIHQMLAKNPNVQKYEFAGPSEGGNGATIVELITD
jgi:DNA mismatch repair protein MutS2